MTHRPPTAADVADFLQWLAEEERIATEAEQQAEKQGRMFLAGNCQGKGTMAFRARMWIIERLTEHATP